MIDASAKPFRKVALIGCGLLGSSLCLDLRQAQSALQISGYNVPLADAQRAQALGVIDQAYAELAQAVDQADLVILATPVGAMAELMVAMAEHLLPDCIVMDVGSVKGAVVKASERLGSMQSRFVPCHPMAGGHHSGCAHARVGLFSKQCVWLTPTSNTDPRAVERVTQLWRALDAEIRIASAQAHDEICAANSHLPHLLAFAFMNSVAEHPQKDMILQSAGAGFRDFSRIAASSPALWNQIFKNNAHALLKSLHSFRQCLQQLEIAIQSTNEDSALLEAIATSQKCRQAWDHLQLSV
jgi:prephenate dehydrogenase